MMALKNILLTLLLVSCYLLPFSAFAAETPPVNSPDAWSKLGRGLGNILFCPFEILYQPSVIAKRGERWPVAFLGGASKGMLFMGVRGLAGVYEVVTFPVPLPAGYKPILKPEFIIPSY